MRISRREIDERGAHGSSSSRGREIAEDVLEAGRFASELEQRPFVVDGGAEDRLAQVVGAAASMREDGAPVLARELSQRATPARVARRSRIASLTHAVRLEHHAVAAAGSRAHAARRACRRRPACRR